MYSRMSLITWLLIQTLEKLFTHVIKTLKKRPRSFRLRQVSFFREFI